MGELQYNRVCGLDGESPYYHSGVGIWDRVMVGALDNTFNEFTFNLGEYEKEVTDPNSIQYDMDRNFDSSINKTLYRIRKWNGFTKKFGS